MFVATGWGLGVGFGLVTGGLSFGSTSAMGLLLGLGLPKTDDRKEPLLFLGLLYFFLKSKKHCLSAFGAGR
ncbi:hypothetical protein C900_00591 [Fulvivirga imtechensis AK7]|uniref:Uncharacterized protein n=1 Tax=Fulvivirga imtechensis AK7 TaxID=1237149 RepID=L8JLH9_9BACT|nr:hypothetical protein C900_00591 [Fulvivirga imtechensis AK7]